MGVKQVNIASDQMNQVVQNNAAHAQECAAAAIQLDQAFRDFGGIIALIEKTIRGSSAATESASVARSSSVASIDPHSDFDLPKRDNKALDRSHDFVAF